MKNGFLLINLGTPANPSKAAVRRFLGEFLSDKRVLNLPVILRYLLLYGLILPFRTRRSTRAYQAIWTAEGSPMLYHCQNLVDKLQERFGVNTKVALGMRYGKPSIHEALEQLRHCETITILPLYPQYSSAATGSSIEKVMRLLASQSQLPSIKLIRDFHSHPSFILAQAELIKPYIANHDHLLFSYHGLPVHQLKQGGCQQVCSANCPPTSSLDKDCYRAQCMQTSNLIALNLNLSSEKYSTSFQSRLGKIPWIQPYTDEILANLIAQGIGKLAIVCPSFVADCLETLEEIGIRLKQQWIQLGGKQLTLIPCLNDSEPWLDAVMDIYASNECHPGI